ncbi:MAG TPA: hypothetical protein VF893_06480 [Candidatus Bathyarchaeia archaeon]
MDFYPNLPRGLIAAELRHNTDTERLNAELKQMVKENVDIVSQLKTLTDDALKEFKLEYRPICRKTNTVPRKPKKEAYLASIFVGKIHESETIRKTITTMQPSALVEHVN